MIRIEIFQPDEKNPYKQVYFRNEDDQCIRHIWIDSDNHIVRDYLTEFRPDQGIKCIVLYGADHTNILGVKEYEYDQDDKLKVIYEYQILNDLRTRISKMENIRNADGNLDKVVFYGESDTPLGYQLFSFADPKYGGMLSNGTFNMNDERVKGFYFDRLSLF